MVFRKMKKIINTLNAPLAIGTYSQGVTYQNMVFTSGQICLNPETGKLNNNNFKDEVRQVLNNLNGVLVESGSSLNKILKVTVYITDLALFSELNEIFLEFFPKHPPARSAVEVSALPMNVRVEIEAIGII
jgi:2-iminobutanoate/2-iminopropanoate deaminase